MKLTNKKQNKLNESMTKNYFELLGWLYEKHKDVLREYEKERGNLRLNLAELES